MTLKVVDELRQVDVKPAMRALEKNSALNNSQKVNLDLSNLQVISHETQELLGLVVKHVRLQNIPITFSGSSQIDPGILLEISEGRPKFYNEQKQVKDMFTIKPKYFSSYSKPFFSSDKHDSINQNDISDSDIDQINTDNDIDHSIEENQTDAEDIKQDEFSEKYSRLLVFSWFLFIVLIGMTIIFFIMLWYNKNTVSVEGDFKEEIKSSLTLENNNPENTTQITEKPSLIDSVKKGNIIEVKGLLAEGTELELKDQNGYTPLMNAVKQQNSQIVKLLADYGANVNISDELEDTPLVWASSMKNAEIVKILLENGADPDKGNFSPVMWSAFHGNIPMLKLFIQYRANLNARTHEGWTALMWTAEKGNIQAMWELLRRGARVNMQNNSGQTALMLASRSGNIAAVGLLLKKGGDAAVVDFEKKSALDYAREHQHKDVMRLLEKEL